MLSLTFLLTPGSFVENEAQSLFFQPESQIMGLNILYTPTASGNTARRRF